MIRGPSGTMRQNSGSKQRNSGASGGHSGMQWEILGVSGAGGHFSERKGQFRSVQGNSGSARGISGSTQPLEAYRKFPGARREFQGAYDTGNSRSTQKILEPKGSWGERGLGSHGEVTQCYLFFWRLGPHLAPPTSTRLTRPSSRPECRSSSPHAPRLLQITIRFKKQTWKPLSLSLSFFLSASPFQASLPKLQNMG